MKTEIMTVQQAKKIMPFLTAEFKQQGLTYALYYYSTKKKPYVVCVCVAVELNRSDPLIYRGVAFQAENDQPCKAIGRVYAMRRVLRAFKHGDTELFLTNRVIKIINSVSEVCSTPEILIQKCTVTDEPTEFECRLLKL